MFQYFTSPTSATHTHSRQPLTQSPHAWSSLAGWLAGRLAGSVKRWIVLVSSVEFSCVGVKTRAAGEQGLDWPEGLDRILGRQGLDWALCRGQPGRQAGLDWALGTGHWALGREAGRRRARAH